MSTQDDEFIKRLRATFMVEAEEHVQAISSKLLELEKRPLAPDVAAGIESIYREAHSLKGAARAVDFGDVEAICQALESVFSAWKQRPTVPSAEAFDLLHRSMDAIRMMLKQEHSAPETEVSRQRPEIIRQLNHLQSQAFLPSDGPSTASIPAATHESSILSPPVESEKSPVAETVRIPVAKLVSRLLQAEEMLSMKSIAEQHARELRDLAQKMELWRKQWAKVSPNLHSLRRTEEGIESGDLVEFLEWNCDFVHSLDVRLSALASQAEQNRYSLDRQTHELLEDSKKLLMLPFSTISSMFPKLIRDLCRDQKKDADLLMRGDEVEIDKRVLEEMKDALIHVLRNCVDHGIESPDQRVAQNKPVRATVSMAVSRINGSKVEIAVSDDGQGIDLDRVKASAVRHGLLSPTQAAGLGDADALALVFQSEVSSSPVVTEVSGRGLGMAIVRAKAEKLGGSVTIESKRSIGTTLRITLPMTMATFRGVIVTAANQMFVVPAASVERVLRLAPGEIRTVENREAISVAGQALSLARLGGILGLAPQVGETPSTPIPILILHAGGQRIAFAVDEVLHEEEVLVKTFRKPLVRVPNVSGATVLGAGNAVLILNVNDLMKSARVRGAQPQLLPVTTTPLKSSKGKLLVVEDSITSRMLLKGILESAGYQVKTAVDGQDAYTMLREDRFDLVVSDVEMPRLNGFDLTARIRADKRLADLPVILVTALESREERERGIDAGASAYIIKSSFDQSSLLQAVQRLI